MKKFIAIITVTLFCVASLAAQTVIDSTGTPNGGTITNLFEVTGLIYSGLVVLVTALGQKFGLFAKIEQKWLYSVAVGLVLAVCWVVMGFTGFISLLTMYFPIAGSIYQMLKTTGLLKLVGLEKATK